MTPTSFAYLRTFVKEKSGIDLAADKQYLVESRLQPLARRNGIAGLEELIQQLKNPANKKLAADVIEAMTTNESSFFRDKTPFEHFKNIMVPELVKTRGAGRRLRIWCAAASNGQEPYSLAMSAKEIPEHLGGWTVSILGTDLSQEVLEKAKSGVYSQFEVQRGMPIQLLLKYFTQEGEMWRVDGKLRAMIDFRQFNLLDTYTSLGRFDIVFCRNVLIYFDPPTKRDILDRISQILAPDGYLVLGSAETVMGITDSFEQVPGQRGLYAKKGAQADNVQKLTPAAPKLAVGGGLPPRATQAGATGGATAHAPKLTLRPIASARS